MRAMLRLVLAKAWMPEKGPDPEEEQYDDHGGHGGDAQTLQAEAVDGNKNEDRSGECGHASSEHRIERRESLGALEMQRRRNHESGEYPGEQGVGDEQPGFWPAALRD